MFVKPATKMQFIRFFSVDDDFIFFFDSHLTRLGRTSSAATDIMNQPWCKARDQDDFALGKVNQIVAPRSNAPSAQIRPPCRITMRRTFARPIPVPSNSSA